MNLPVFIARRIKKPGSDTFSSTIHKIAIGSVAVGLFIMLISIMIMVGFRQTIRDKVSAFNGDLQITKYTMSSTYEELPVSRNMDFFKEVVKLPYINHIQGVAHKVALIKTSKEIQGVEFKGIGKDFDFNRFRNDIVEGEFLNFSDSSVLNDIVVSRKIADILDIRVHDQILLYFVQKPVRVRKLNVCGIYDSGMEEFDEKIVFGDIRVIQQLNDWSHDLCGTFEVFVKDRESLEAA